MNVEVILTNNEKLTVAVGSITQFDDQFRFGDSTVVLESTDGTRFRANAIIAYKPTGEANEQ